MRTTVAETTLRTSIARRILRSRISSAVAAAVVTASVAGGVAYAAIEPIDAEGTIHGCYNPASGALKLLTMPACPTKGYTTAIAWSQQGPAGPAGATGAAGPAGPTGAQGPAGPQGAAGGIDERELWTVNHAQRVRDYCAIACTSPGYRPIAEVSYLRSGRFLVHADLTLDIGTNTTGTVPTPFCFVGGTRGSLPSPYNWFFASTFMTPARLSAGAHASASLNFVLNNPTPGPVGIHCEAPDYVANDIDATGSMSLIQTH